MQNNELCSQIDIVKNVYILTCFTTPIQQYCLGSGKRICSAVDASSQNISANVIYTIPNWITSAAAEVYLFAGTRFLVRYSNLKVSRKNTVEFTQ